jgi:hypothetical protein
VVSDLTEVTGDTSLTAGSNTLGFKSTDGLQVTANAIKGVAGATSVEMLTTGVELISPTSTITTALTVTSPTADTSSLEVLDAGVTIEGADVSVTGSGAILDLNSNVSLDPASGSNVSIATTGSVGDITIGSTSTTSASFVTAVASVAMDATGVAITTTHADADFGLDVDGDVAVMAGAGKGINIGTIDTVAQTIVAGSTNAGTTVSVVGGASSIAVAQAGVTVSGDSTFVDDVSVSSTLSVTGTTTLDDSVIFTGDAANPRLIRVADQAADGVDGGSLTIVAGIEL